MMNRTINYWQDLHRNLRDIDQGSEFKNLQIVCCTGLSAIYNKMIHHFQALSVKRALALLGDMHNKEILEIGCGTGRWCSFFSRLSDNVNGIDISKDAIEINKRLYPNINFKQMPAQRLDFPDDKFDFIFSVTVLQHIPYMQKEMAIREMHRCLKVGGFTVILEQIRPKSTTPLDFEHTITFPYTAEEWKVHFEELGYQLVWAERIIFLPLILNAFFPLKRFMARIFGLQSKNSVKNKNDKFKNLDNKLNYIVTLITVPISFILEYFFIYILQAGKWCRQDIFGRHQIYIFKKLR